MTPGGGFRPQRKKRSRTKRTAGARAFLETPKGQEWLARKIAEKNSNRPDPGPAPERLTRTKFPFSAYINGDRYTVMSSKTLGRES